MAKRKAETANVADELVASLEQAVAITRGELAPGRATEREPEAVRRALAEDAA